MSRIDTHRASYNKPNISLGKRHHNKPDCVFIRKVEAKYVVYEHKQGLAPYVWLTTASFTKATLLAERLRKSAD